MFKYIHEILATNDRLFKFNIVDNSKCLNCGEVENNMHLMYFCPLAKNLLAWFKGFLLTLCKVESKSFLQILKLDFKAYSRKDRNTAMLLISEYIAGIWFGHKIGLLTDDPQLILYIKNRIKRNRKILAEAYSTSMWVLFTKAYINFS